MFGSCRRAFHSINMIRASFSTRLLHFRPKTKFEHIRHRGPTAPTTNSRFWSFPLLVVGASGSSMLIDSQIGLIDVKVDVVEEKQVVEERQQQKRPLSESVRQDLRWRLKATQFFIDSYPNWPPRPNFVEYPLSPPGYPEFYAFMIEHDLLRSQQEKRGLFDSTKLLSRLRLMNCSLATALTEDDCVYLDILKRNLTYMRENECSL